MKRTVPKLKFMLAVAITGTILVTAACDQGIPAQQYADLQSQFNKAQSDLSSAKATNASLQQQINQLQTDNANLRSQTGMTNAATPTPKAAPPTIAMTPTPTIPSTPAPITTIELTASDLWQAYRTNLIGADAQYKGKTVKITGMLTGITRDSSGTAYVTVFTGFSSSGVKCMFNKQEETSLAKLAAGQTVPIQGVVDGASTYTTPVGNSVDWVLMKDCKLVP